MKTLIEVIPLNTNIHVDVYCKNFIRHLKQLSEKSYPFPIPIPESVDFIQINHSGIIVPNYDTYEYMAYPFNRQWLVKIWRH